MTSAETQKGKQDSMVPLSHNLVQTILLSTYSVSGTVFRSRDRDECPSEWESPQHTHTNDSRMGQGLWLSDTQDMKEAWRRNPIPDGQSMQINGSFLKR